MTKTPAEDDASRELDIGRLGVGTWAWGDEKWGYGRADASYDDETLREAFQAAVDLGVTLFDTSEVYGRGHAERARGAREFAAKSAKKMRKFPCRSCASSAATASHTQLVVSGVFRTNALCAFTEGFYCRITIEDSYMSLYCFS